MYDTRSPFKLDVRAWNTGFDLDIMLSQLQVASAGQTMLLGDMYHACVVQYIESGDDDSNKIGEKVIESVVKWNEKFNYEQCTAVIKVKEVLYHLLTKDAENAIRKAFDLLYDLER